MNVSNYKVANFNEEVLDIGQPGGASVSVTSPGGGDNGGGGGGNGGGDNGAGGDGGGSEKKSANNQLSSLKISPGTLSPSFTGSRTKYTATVPKGTTKVAVSANPMEKEAEVVSIDGTELSNGKTTIKIIVRAPNGNEATYSIAVTEEAKSQETPTPTPKPDEEQPEEDDTLEAAVGSEIRLVSEKFTEEEIPQGFEPHTSKMCIRDSYYAMNGAGIRTFSHWRDPYLFTDGEYAYHLTLSLIHILSVLPFTFLCLNSAGRVTGV